jgi:hypothetical protein
LLELDALVAVEAGWPALMPVLEAALLLALLSPPAPRWERVLPPIR